MIIVIAVPLFELAPPAPDRVIAACPAGPVVDAADGSWGLATASFSADRSYRYRLSRVWDASAGRVNFLMLNPSTADAFTLDQTARRCVGFAQTWGLGGVEVTNAFAVRSRSPRVLRDVSDPVGPGNDAAILAAASSADLIIVAWGVHATWRGRDVEVRRLLAELGATPHYLRLTKEGHPGHPLYVPADTESKPWVL